MLDCSDKIRTVACDEKFNSEVFMETNYKTGIFDYPLRMKMSLRFVYNQKRIFLQITIFISFKYR